jgi:hypothetical protein
MEYFHKTGKNTTSKIEYLPLKERVRMINFSDE